VNIDTLRRVIQQESAARIEVGTVIAADMRGTNSCSVRLSGGVSVREPTTVSMA